MPSTPTLFKLTSTVNRSYQITYWPNPPNKQLCNAPPTPAHPSGDPNIDYFKCHSGELMLVFGTWRKWGLPERDSNDTPFTQFIIDSWSSFVRTQNPNPSLAFLQARGYSNTTAELAMAGSAPWAEVTADSQTLRFLEWPSRQVGFRESAQCAALGQALGYILQRYG